MRKIFIGTLILCLLLSISFTGCNSNNPGPSGTPSATPTPTPTTTPTPTPGPFTGDNFDSYPTGSWFLPLNGWQSMLSKPWYISDQGVGGSHALFFSPNSQDGVIHAADTSNYILSVQIKYAATDPGIAPTATKYASIIGRCTDIFSYYSATIYNSSGNVRLNISKHWQTGSTTHVVSPVSTIWFSGNLDVHTWYTLSLKCNGSNVRAYASGGGQTPIDILYTDNGLTYGPVLTGANVGLHSYAEVSFHPFFDNFTVTAL